MNRTLVHVLASGVPAGAEALDLRLYPSLLGLQALELAAATPRERAQVLGNESAHGRVVLRSPHPGGAAGTPGHRDRDVLHPCPTVSQFHSSTVPQFHSPT